MVNRTIKIKRSAEIFPGKSEAVAFLNRIPHKLGQLVMSRYHTGETSTDTVVAVGITAGMGPGSYSIISSVSTRVIDGIVTQESELPDSTSLVNGQTYIYKEPVTGDLFWIYLNEDIRETTPIDPSIHYRVLLTSDDTEYWVYDGAIERTDDYYSRETTDRKIQEAEERLSDEIEELSVSVNDKLIKIITGTGLTQEGDYAGTIVGATSLDSADNIIWGRLEATREALRSVTNRVADIENEFLSTTDGLDLPTRLDQVYSWFDEETHKPSYKITFERLTEGPIILGSTQTIKTLFEWSWADRAELTGIKLDNAVKSFASGLIGEASQANGSYEWLINWEIPTVPQNASANISVASKTWAACFTKRAQDVERTSYTLVSEPVVVNINIAITDSGWKVQPEDAGYSVTFNGSGLPTTWSSSILTVQQGSTVVYNRIQGIEPNLEATYSGTFDSSRSTTIRASWAGKEETFHITPSFWGVLETSTLGIPQNPEIAFLTSRETELPEHAYESGNSVIYLSPHDLTGSRIFFTGSPQEPPLEITNEWQTGTISYRELQYNYLFFPNVGAGIFKFYIQ